jgi:uncharacterized membrane protein YoaK (UPF0700 family)
MKVFGRDPAIWIALLAAILQLANGYLLHLSPEATGAINGVVVAVFGVWTAATLPNWGDRILPALLGLAQAVFIVFAAFGQDLDPETQGQWMALITTLVGMFVRTQVTAPVDQSGQKRSPVHAID